LEKCLKLLQMRMIGERSTRHFIEELGRLRLENDRRFFLACGFDKKVINSIFPLDHQHD
jgi:hypothetical protein